MVANVGDSRAVLCTRGDNHQHIPIQLTADQKPNVPSGYCLCNKNSILSNLRQIFEIRQMMANNSFRRSQRNEQFSRFLCCYPTYLNLLLGTTDLHSGIIFVYFELSWLCFWFYQETSYQDIFLTYKPRIISLTSSQPFSTILPLKEVHHRISPEVYGALE